MIPAMMLMTVQREREVELQRLAMRRPLWRERSTHTLARKQRLVALGAVYRRPLTSLRALRGPHKVNADTAAVPLRAPLPVVCRLAVPARRRG